MRLSPLACALMIAAAAPVCAQDLLRPAVPASGAQVAHPEAQALSQALEYYCADWVSADAPRTAGAMPDKAKAAGWTERPAGGAPTSMHERGGEWGDVALVRLALADGGHRCTISMRIGVRPFSTDASREAVGAFVMRTWPQAKRVKDRGEGPRNTLESLWAAPGDLVITLQEAKSASAPPSIFVLVTRQKLPEA